MPRASHRILIAGAALAALATPLAATAAHADYLGPIGRPGLGDGSLGKPWGIAAAPDGRIYVSEAGRGQVSAFDSAGRFLKSFGSMVAPQGIAAGAGGVYVADRDAHRVARFTLDGAALGTFGKQGVANGQFEYPEGVAIQGDRVLVTSQYRFQRFTAAGAFVDGHGGAGAGEGDFEGVRGIATGSDGKVFTTEVANHRVQRFSPGFAFETQWGEKGTLDGQFAYPSGLAVDSPTSSVWVADVGTGKVQRFGAGGQLRDIIGPGPVGSPDHLTAPTDVAVDCRGTVYVVDLAAAQVQRYGPVELPVAGNLVRNGGFEQGGAGCDSSAAVAGAGPGWSAGGGAATAVHYGAAAGFPARSEGDAADGGQSFLAGGPNNAQVVKDQTIDVSGDTLDIDDGRRLARVSARLGGYATQDDAAKVESVYLDAGGKVLATSTLGPVTAADRGGKTTLLPREASLTVPTGTRSIRVRVTLTRAGTAGYNDAYVDQVALTVTPQRPPATTSGPTTSGPTTPGPTTPGTTTPGPTTPGTTTSGTTTSGSGSGSGTGTTGSGTTTGSGAPSAGSTTAGPDVTDATTGTGAATARPRITLRVAGAARAASTGRVTVSAGCDRRCAITVNGRVAGRIVATGSRPSQAGTRTLTLRLSSPARAGLRRTIRSRGRATIVLSVRATSAGATTTVTRTVTVRG